MTAPFNGSAVPARQPVKKAPQNRDRMPRLAAHHVPFPANAKAQPAAASVPRSAIAKPAHTAAHAISRCATRSDPGRLLAFAIALTRAPQAFQKFDEIAELLRGHPFLGSR